MVEDHFVPSKLLPVATLGLFIIAPALAYAAPQAAVSLRARATVSHDELAKNTAKGLATPVGIASAQGNACELRCVLANPDATGQDTETLLCELGEVRAVKDGFELTAVWTESGVTFQPSEPLEFDSCK
ncbi:MAG: hypothetical protein ACE37F_06695 [Nannocystaceae bacterium]|nr:hypothetical protein [bacterium]